MTDPTFDPAGGDYASGRVTLHKTRGPALAASQVGPVDVVLLSHDQHAVVLLFGGGAQVRGPFYLTMNTNDAVEAAAAFGEAVIVPVHHDGWAHFTQSQEDLAKTFQALGMGDRLRRVTGGETLRLGAR